MTQEQPRSKRRLHGLLFKLPMMITCLEFEEFILAYLEDDLPRRQRMMFEAHLKLWRECRAYLAAYKTTLSVTRAQKDVDLPEVPQDLVAAVVSAMKEEE